MRIEAIGVVSVPVSDQDRSRDFYTGVLGFELLADVRLSEHMRWVQVAPPGSPTSLTLVNWFETMPAGSLKGLVRLVDDMVETMYEAVGAGLAAPQVGVQRRLFVYDLDDDAGPQAIINPEIVESSGELYHDEACLSIPGLRIGIVRPETVLLKGYDLDGNELSIEADDFMGRMFQHEVDHLDGVLMVERLDDEMRKQALRILRDRAMGRDTSAMEAKLVSAGSDREV